MGTPLGQGTSHATYYQSTAPELHRHDTNGSFPLDPTLSKLSLGPQGQDVRAMRPGRTIWQTRKNARKAGRTYPAVDQSDSPRSRVLTEREARERSVRCGAAERGTRRE